MKKLVTLALIAGAVALLAKFAATQKAQWQGLTESEVRDKLEARLPGRIPADKRQEIADKIVTGMREGGAFGDEDEPYEPAEEDQGDAEADTDLDVAGATQESDDTAASS